MYIVLDFATQERVVDSAIADEVFWRQRQHRAWRTCDSNVSLVHYRNQEYILIADSVSRDHIWRDGDTWTHLCRSSGDIPVSAEESALVLRRLQPAIELSARTPHVWNPGQTIRELKSGRLTSSHAKLYTVHTCRGKNLTPAESELLQGLARRICTPQAVF